MNEVTIARRTSVQEFCILVTGARRGLFIPIEVLDWLQSEEIGWTVKGDHERITFTIPDETERMLFTLRFAHLRA